MEPLDAISQLQQVTAGRRVALVHDWLNGMRGGEKVFEHLCALFPRADVFTLFHEPERLSPALRAMCVHEHPWPRAVPALRRHYRYLLPLMPAMVRAFPTAGYDLVVSTSHCVAKAVPPPAHGLHLSYVHSPMRYVWDRWRDYLTGNPIKDAALRAVRPRLQTWDRESSQAVDALAANSHYVARKIERFWGRRARVIHPPVDVDFFTPGDGEAGERFLCVGALVPYKRFDRAIEAARLAGARLDIVGEGPERARLEALAGPAATFHGWVPDEQLRTFYRRCLALLYPGEEDFGITALEAQACGRPVLALRRGGARETVRDGQTGRFFDRPDARALADGLTAFDSGAYQPSIIRAWAERFGPQRFRQEVARWILQETMARGWGDEHGAPSSCSSSS
jgi:glycosyltransferase involved in cell wall biosynthesis